MSTLNFMTAATFDREAPLCQHAEGVVEIPLLLTERQAKALERAAHAYGLTTGEMVRQMLQDFLAQQLPY